MFRRHGRGIDSVLLVRQTRDRCSFVSPFSRLGDPQKKIVRECLVAILEGPFIPEWELHARVGLDREGLRSIIEKWPELDDAEQNSPAHLAINNCMNEVCHDIRFSVHEWKNWFTASRETIQSIYRKWTNLSGY